MDDIGGFVRFDLLSSRFSDRENNFLFHQMKVQASYVSQALEIENG